MSAIWRSVVVVGMIIGLAGSSLAHEPADSLQSERLLSGLRPLLSSLSGREDSFRLSGTASLQIDGSGQAIQFAMTRFDDESFELALEHTDYAVTIRRQADVTALALPRHGKVYIGHGQVAEADRLSPKDVLSRLISRGSTVSSGLMYVNLLAAGDIDAIVQGLLPVLKISHDAETDCWTGPDGIRIFVPSAGEVRFEADRHVVSLVTLTDVGSPASAEDWPGLTPISISRDELERTLLRGVRRAAEILAPSPLLTQPDQSGRDVPNGRLIWKDGQRIALLKGTPEEIGTAHGQLLPAEAGRCIESVLYAFGTAHVIRTGQWFRHELEAAYGQLAPHIPERHKVETRALAAALNLDAPTVEALNVFPELFHCSGFAVFGSATRDGRLYHGRVLDYMTTIGLQDAATTFIVAPADHIAFANVGYAGFIGSVSGMNAQAISLGEMGGRGEGQWDGAPMATLMRRALEECHTLQDVKTLWTDSPRTCEYYYVFADGKSGEAVGVAATPQSLQFIAPGEGHELLGEGIADAVVLSAGSRLEELRRRVQERHGKIDAETGMWLMSRPVAMQSNLHNVLFIPADGVLYVANASHTKPAAETPYVRIALHDMLSQLSGLPAPVAPVVPLAAGVRERVPPAANVNSRQPVPSSR